MPLYEPLTQGFRDLNQMLITQQKFDAAMGLEKMKMAQAAKAQEFQLQTQLAEEDRKAQARQILGQDATKLVAHEPFTELQNRDAELTNTIPKMQEEVKGLGNNYRNAAYRLALNTNIAALQSEHEHVKKQLSDPVWMANQYHSKAAKLGELSAKVAGFDLQSATFLQAEANRSLNQGDMFLAEARLQQERKAARQQGIKVFDKNTGEVIRVAQLGDNEPLILGNNETTLTEKETTATELVHFMDKNTGQEIGAEYVSKKDDPRFLAAARQRVAKAAGVDPNTLVTHYQTTPQIPGSLTESQAADIAVRSMVKEDPVSKMIAPIAGLGVKVRAVRQATMASISGQPPENRGKIAAEVEATFSNLEQAYWDALAAIDANKTFNMGQKRNEKKKVLEQLLKEQRLLTQIGNDPDTSITYIPDSLTKNNLEGR